MDCACAPLGPWYRLYMLPSTPFITISHPSGSSLGGLLPLPPPLGFFGALAAASPVSLSTRMNLRTTRSSVSPSSYATPALPSSRLTCMIVPAYHDR